MGFSKSFRKIRRRFEKRVLKTLIPGLGPKETIESEKRSEERKDAEDAAFLESQKITGTDVGAVEEARIEELRKAKRRRGFKATILTGGRGLSGAASTGTKRLFGQ